jgi:hypothetical protein
MLTHTQGQRILCLGILAAITSCGGHAPALPVAPSPATAPAPQPQAAPSGIVHGIGVVTDGDSGAPIAGATVTQPFSSVTPATTDGNGYYDIAVSESVWDYGIPIWISKPGYDDTHGWADANDGKRHDFRLFRPITIAAGAATHVTISADNSLCGFDDDYRCRLVRVAAPSSGTLVVQSTADNPAKPIWLVTGTDVGLNVASTTNLSIPVTAGAVVDVLLYRFWSPPPTDAGTITTTLLP